MRRKNEEDPGRSIWELFVLMKSERESKRGEKGEERKRKERKEREKELR